MLVWGFAGGGHMTSRIADKLSDAGAERVLTHWSQAQELFATL
jgi:hypothetical protein